MKRVKLVSTLLMSLSLLSALNSQAHADEKPVRMKNLPKAVQQTVKQQSKGAKIRGLSMETENGNVYYEVELRINGHSKDVLIDQTGAVVEVEEETSFDSLPQAVKAGIESHAEGGRIVFVESITRNATIVAYEAQIRLGQRILEVKVDTGGQLISKENDEDEAREKAASKKTSQKDKNH